MFRTFLLSVCLVFAPVSAYAKDGGTAAQPKATVEGLVTLPVTAMPAPVKAAPTTQPATVTPAEPGTVPEAVGTFKGIIADFRSGKYREAVAGVLMVLMFLWRRFAGKLVIGKIKSDWWLRFVTLLVSFAATIPVALTADGFNWTRFLWEGLATGAEAMLFWSLVLSKILPSSLKPTSLSTVPVKP